MGNDSYDRVGLRDRALDGWFNSQTHELAPGFSIRPGELILDMGCGSGMFSPFCVENGARVILADIDAEKIKLAEASARSVNPASVETLVTNADPLPLPDAYADKVLLLEVLEHVEDPAKFLAELVRVAKPGAEFLISVPGTMSETVQKTLAPESYFLPPNHIRIFQPGSLAALAESQGLIIEKQLSFGFYQSIWWSFFWTCNQDLSPPWHPLLQSWDRTWSLLLDSPDGLKIKRTLDNFLPKCEALIARKPS